MKTKFAVDRIEDDRYVLIGAQAPSCPLLWPKAAMPLELKEGDIIDITVEKDETARSREEDCMRSLIDELLSRP